MSLTRREKPLKVADRLESVKSAAARLDCSYNTIIALIGKGDIRATADKPILVNKSDVDARIRRMFKQAGITEAA